MIETRRSKYGLLSKVILINLDLALLGTTAETVAAVASHEKDVFYLKLQWISAKDEAEKKNMAEKIRKVLSEERKT